MNAPSGLISPDGEWAVRCPADGIAALALADLGEDAGNYARPWRRTARSGIYGPHIIRDDPRSSHRAAF